MSREDLKPGDHIYVDCGSYYHHGIYCGDGKVIHYHNDKVRWQSLRRFANERKVHVKKYRKCKSPERVLARAKKRVGEKKYNFFFNNCEHFATWCKIGSSRCRQIEKLDRSLPKIVKFYSRKSTAQVEKVASRLLRRTRRKLIFR